MRVGEARLVGDAIEQQVKWAGKPEKEYSQGPFGPRINPRGSFDAYLEEQRNRSAAWDNFDMASAREIQVMLTQITAKAEREQMTRSVMTAEANEIMMPCGSRLVCANLLWLPAASAFLHFQS